MYTVYVGDVTEYLSIFVKDLHSDAYLTTEDNYQSIKNGAITYTSICDFKHKNNFIKFLELAKKIIFCPPKYWSHPDTESETLTILMYLSSHTMVLGLEKYKKELITEPTNRTRKTNESQLWIVGCSVSHGLGVNQHERYGEILSAKLNLTANFLTKEGTSIEWAAHQILQSDLRPNDYVVWGITNENRFTHYGAQQKVKHITHRSYITDPSLHEKVSITQIFDHDHLMYNAIVHLHQVINFCKILNVKLILAGVIVTNDLLPFLFNMPNYIHLNKPVREFRADRGYLDLGTDGEHPGPLTHKWYADKILEFIKK